MNLFSPTVSSKSAKDEGFIPLWSCHVKNGSLMKNSHKYSILPRIIGFNSVMIPKC